MTNNLPTFNFLTISAPNVYKIPTVLGSSVTGPIRSAPAYSITGKLKNKLPQCIQFPGPGSYDAKIDFTLKKPPVFSMASRYNIPSDNNMKPGMCRFPFMVVDLNTGFCDFMPKEF